MDEERIQVNRYGFERLQQAADDFARAEIERLAAAAIDDLRSRPANAIFSDVAARHMWDEYCCALQEGPLDVAIGLGDQQLGTLSGGFDDAARAAIRSEVEKLPEHYLVLLSLKAFEEDGDLAEAPALGSIWMDGIVMLVLDEVNDRASRRDLNLIGPQRSDVIGYEVEGSGMVWDMLRDRGEALGVIASHCDSLLDPDGDLSMLAEEMIEAFMAVATEDEEGVNCQIFLERFEDEVRDLIREKDVMPTLEAIRGGLLEQLDG